MAQSEIRRCQNCHNPFTIEPDDFEFYKKIKVSTPTWCPECRLVRRLSYRNESTYHKVRCALCGKNIISMYSKESGLPVYCQECWWSDGWNPTDFGTDYSFSKPFFRQLSDLYNRVPHEALQGRQKENSEYTNFTLNGKNVYLSSIVLNSERIFFSRATINSRDSLECDHITGCENCYQLSLSASSSNCAFGANIEYCMNTYFTSYSTNCSNCYGCINLRHKSYYIFNQQYLKEEYEKKLEELIGQPIEVQEKKVLEFYLSQPFKAYNIFQSQNVSGEEIYHTKNCRHCFLSNYIRDAGYVLDVTSLSKNPDSVHEVFDCSIVADVNLFYEMIGGSEASLCRFGIINDNSLDIQYSNFCYGSSYLFGCVGLKNKQYCILNKQYTKEEYEVLVPRIIAHMNKMPYTDSRGRIYRYGEFFPPDLSPFAYNETIAQEYFPLTKDQALAQGYRWKDPEKREYEITKHPEDLPDHSKDVPDAITQEVIQCAHAKHYGGLTSINCNHQCTTAFKIIPEELSFYRRMNLPLPQLCPNCRHYERLKQRNPLKLWHRTCQCEGEKSEREVYTNTASHLHGTAHCLNEFETPYAPDRPEIVYCEQCYNAEVL